jgi:hypothetical protein
MTEDSERVEELESKVAELEATVRGLTEELVDATARIRHLEGATDVDPAGEHGREETVDQSDAATPASDGGTTEADTPKGPASEDSTANDEGDVAEDDDIIVA